MPKQDMKWDECVDVLKRLQVRLKRKGSLWSRERYAVNKAIALIHKERYVELQKK